MALTANMVVYRIVIKLEIVTKGVGERGHQSIVV
jgi:hypothetical protein